MTDQTTPPTYFVKLDCDGRLLECFRDKHRKNTEGVIERTGDDFWQSPNAYDCLFQYFRADDYAISDIGRHERQDSDTVGSEGTTTTAAARATTTLSIQETLKLHIDVFVAAIDYDLTGLQDKAAARFHKLLQNSNWKVDDILPSVNFVCDYRKFADPRELEPIRNAVLDAVLPVAHDVVCHEDFYDFEDEGGANVKYFGFLKELVELLSLKVNLGMAVTGFTGAEEEKRYKQECKICEKRHS
ncbi:hypothetical protein PRZ48_004169 [Zasmidium cellare]|uniref:Uncharacterized protein n=1 Tax=Zasmidium cellare TaxID=395010 RepID=A0ABR0EXV4_ZASCE|nr:hypothetical protein PRZ48_004169 [Zasmidium cellare]